MEFRFLGPFDVVDDQRIVPIVGGKQRALLAILALHANEVVPVGRLIDDLWPDEPPDSALNSIQAYVSRLRKALNGNGTGSAAEAIVFRHGGYMLDVSAEQIDAHRFARLVEDGERRIDAGDVTSGRRRATRGARPLARACAVGLRPRAVRTSRRSPGSRN